MKKLMIATLAAAAVGGAFAEPLVYDYKASVKHTYEKEAKYQGAECYVKYVKSAKLQGYFVQDFDALTTLAQRSLAGANFSQKKGFLVLINKSAEKDWRLPKIMPAQIDVKALATSSSTKGSTTTVKRIVEAYFYAGPFASHPDTVNIWDASYDAGIEWLFNNGSAAPGVQARTYGTFGSTLYLFGQHNVANAYNNDDATGYEPATFHAFGDAWMNGAGFGNGTGKSTLCCGWPGGTANFGSISGNLKGGLFLCSEPNRPIYDETEGGYFTLGIEDVYQDDTTGALGRTVQGDDKTAALKSEKTASGTGKKIGDSEWPDRKVWADGELTLSTTDVVSGTWTLKPTSNLEPVVIDAAEDAFFTANTAGTYPAEAIVLRYIKAALQKLDRNYGLTTGVEPNTVFGSQTSGLMSPLFVGAYL